MSKHQIQTSVRASSYQGTKARLV